MIYSKTLIQVGAEAAGAVRAEHPPADARVQGGAAAGRDRAPEVHLPREGRHLRHRVRPRLSRRLRAGRGPIQ